MHSDTLSQIMRISGKQEKDVSFSRSASSQPFSMLLPKEMMSQIKCIGTPIENM